MTTEEPIKKIEERELHGIISHVIVGIDGATKGDYDNAPPWVSAGLRDKTPGKKRDYFLLAGTRGYGMLGMNSMCLILAIEGHLPMMFTLSMGDGEAEDVFRLDGGKVILRPDLQLDVAGKLSEMKERLGFVSAETCSTCGTEFDKGSAQRFCDKCGQPKAKEDPPVSRYCEHCGKRSPSAFCEYCGQASTTT